MGLRLRRIDFIVVHCSDSRWGDVDIIREWHRERGWSDIGYHYVILNGLLKGSRDDHPERDGEISVGREERRRGAHAAGYNNNSIGICLIGKDGDFSRKQLAVLPLFVQILMCRFSIPVERVVGHYEVTTKKTCPDLDMDLFRQGLRASFGDFQRDKLQS